MPENVSIHAMLLGGVNQGPEPIGLSGRNSLTWVHSAELLPKEQPEYSFNIAQPKKSNTPMVSPMNYRKSDHNHNLNR